MKNSWALVLGAFMLVAGGVVACSSSSGDGLGATGADGDGGATNDDASGGGAGGGNAGGGGGSGGDDGGAPGSGSTDGGGTSGSHACAPAAYCDGHTGLCTEPRVCAPGGACLDGGVVNGADVSSITTPLTTPPCRTGTNDKLRTWSDAVNGQPRAACVFTPTGASASSKRPLVIFLHGTGEGAASVYTITSLRNKAPTYDLTGDAARPGFVLVSDQGRNTEKSPNGNAAGPKHDWYYRDFATDTSSSDLRNIDRVVDDFVGMNIVDPKRVYIIGYSNGAFSGMLYTLARYATPTPGGNFIAASAIYGGSNPLAEPVAGETDCRYQPLPQAGVAMLMVQRACDWEPCDATQQAIMGRPPGYSLADWLVTLKTQIGARDATSLLLDDTAHVVTACDDSAACTIPRGRANHAHWPNGLHDGSGIDHEPDMLDYLRAHPHP